MRATVWWCPRCGKAKEKITDDYRCPDCGGQITSGVEYGEAPRLNLPLEFDFSEHRRGVPL